MAHDNNNAQQQDAKHLLETIEQVEETLSVMGQVVQQLKQQIASQTPDRGARHIADDDLAQCDNLKGVWH